MTVRIHYHTDPILGSLGSGVNITTFFVKSHLIVNKKYLHKSSSAFGEHKKQRQKCPKMGGILVVKSDRAQYLVTAQEFQRIFFSKNGGA